MRRLLVALVIGLILLLALAPFATILIPVIRDSPASSVTVIRNGDQLLVEGNIAKDFSGPILYGHYTLEDSNSTEYFVRQFNYSIVYGELASTESAESDVCLLLLASDQVTSLSSGGEILCSHQSHVGNGPGSISNITIPGRGFVLSEGYKVDIGTVSQLYPYQVSAPRLNSHFLSLSFSLSLQISKNTELLGTFSQRSPFRDREFVPNPVRKYAPYTDFMNNQTTPAEVYSIGVFLSSISHYYQNRATIEVWKGQSLILSKTMFLHDPHFSDPPSGTLIPINLTLMPRENISVRGRIATDVPQVYDFVSFIMSNSSLVRVNESSLFANYVDVNGDGYPDYMDYDVQGTIWADTTRPNLQGAHDTQFPWARLIPPFSSIKASDKSASVVTITTENGGCLLLERNESIVHYQFVLHYCNEANVPQSQPNLIAWGDFTGNGFLDRLRIDPNNAILYVALGGPTGLAKESVWFTGGYEIDGFSVEHSYSNNKDVLFVESHGIPSAYSQRGENMAFVAIGLPYGLG
ncbi:MAG TPA: hypothetical protein VNA15_11630 [Candidatus Angelobacter sp.]|nr:hypothetical protein [Candidatus Angelobacter sp.]